MHCYKVLKLEPTDYTVIVSQEDKGDVFQYGFTSRSRDKYDDFALESSEELSKETLMAIAQVLQNAHGHGYNRAMRDIQMLMAR